MEDLKLVLVSSSEAASLKSTDSRDILSSSNWLMVDADESAVVLETIFVVSVVSVGGITLMALALDHLMMF